MLRRCSGKGFERQVLGRCDYLFRPKPYICKVRPFRRHEARPDQGRESVKGAVSYPALEQLSFTDEGFHAGIPGRCHEVSERISCLAQLCELCKAKHPGEACHS